MGKGDALNLAIQALETEDIEVLPIEDVGEDLVWFEVFSRRFEAERSRRIGVFDSQQGHDVLGYPLCNRISETPMSDDRGQSQTSGFGGSCCSSFQSNVSLLETWADIDRPGAPSFPGVGTVT